MNNDNYSNTITGTEIYYNTDTNAEIEIEIEIEIEMENEIEANIDYHIKTETHISINIWLIFYNQIECDRLKLLSIEQLTSLFSLSISLQIK